MSAHPTLDELMGEWKPRANSKSAETLRGLGVSMSEDLKRVIALPRRTEAEVPDYTQLLTDAFKRPKGQMKLRHLQAQTLYEVWTYRGAFCMMPVGSGKTIPSFLTPRILKAKIPLLLVPANLLHKAQKIDYPELRKHFRLHPNQVFCSHEKLQTEKNKDYLLKMKPDCIVIDEAHYFKNTKAKRTRVLLRYLDSARKANYPVSLICLSGSMTRKSLRDYWHLITRCLPHQSPLPLSWNMMDEWANAIDAEVTEDRRMQPGALMHLCDPAKEPPGEPDYVRARKGFRRRLVETPGVIATNQVGFDGGIEIHEVPVAIEEIPNEVKHAFFNLRDAGATPDGELVTDAMSLWQKGSQLAFGYFTRWDWKKATKDGKPDLEWLDKRRNWHKIVREVLKYGQNYKPPLDSVMEVTNAFEDGKLWDVAFNEWHEIRERYAHFPNKRPPVEEVWISPYAVYHAAGVMKKLGKKTIAWTASPIVGKALAQVLKIPYFGAGDKASREIDKHKGPCVASVQSHGTGKNLQRYENNLLVGSLHGSSNWQQWLGRTHRSGQKADTVRFYLYLHSKEIHNALYTAITEAEYVEQSTGEPQKLQQATMNVKSVEEVEALLEGRRQNPLWSVAGFQQPGAQQ